MYCIVVDLVFNCDYSGHYSTLLVINQIHTRKPVEIQIQPTSKCFVSSKIYGEEMLTWEYVVGDYL